MEEWGREEREERGGDEVGEGKEEKEVEEEQVMEDEEEIEENEETKETITPPFETTTLTDDDK